MGSPRAVIFDFDFTLGDSSPGIIQCVNYALRTLGLPEVPSETVLQTIGLSLTETFRRLTDNDEPTLARSFSEYFTEHADRVMERSTVIYSAAPRVIRQLRDRGCRTAIVSTKYRYRIENILKTHGLRDQFDAIVGAEDVPQTKPHPAGILRAIDQLQVEIADTLFVGDHTVDAEAAESAGVPFVAILTGASQAADFEPYPKKAVITDLLELLHLPALLPGPAGTFDAGRATDINDLISQFFSEYGGKVIDITASRRPNHQHPSPPGDGLLQCLTVRVVLGNLSIFGQSGSFFTEVFPRYRALSARLTDYLTARRDRQQPAETPLSVNLIPYPDPRGKPGQPLPPLPRPSRGTTTPPIAELANASPYYRSLAQRFHIKYGVLSSNGTVIGPDGGIIVTASNVADDFQRKIDLIELGTGAGSTATALTAARKLARYHGNDFSPEMVAFFEANIQPMLQAAEVPATVECCSCFDYDLGPRADLLIVGVYYEAQPDLFAKSGPAMAAALGDEGVLAAQPGKPENDFITELLHDPQTQHRYWPWYEERFCIKHYFQHVAQEVVEDETMLLGSNQKDRVRRIMMSLQDSRNDRNLDRDAGQLRGSSR